MKVVIAPRKITYALEQAQKDKLVGLTDGGEIGPLFLRVKGTTYKSELFADGWKFSDDGTNLVKMVPMPLMIEAENEATPGGVPDVGEPTDEEVVSAVDDFMTVHKVPPSTLAKIINNGMYLYFNQKNKPKKTGLTYQDAMGAYADAAAKNPAMWAEFGQHVTKPDKGAAFLKEWFSNRPSA